MTHPRAAITRRTFLALAAAGTALLPGRAEAGPHGRWLAEDIRGGGVIDRIQTVLEIAPEGRVSGSGGCNRIVGTARIDGPAMTFSQMASTKMACPAAVMMQEQKFLAALAQVRRWREDQQSRKLILSDDAGTVLMILARM